MANEIYQQIYSTLPIFCSVMNRIMRPKKIFCNSIVDSGRAFIRMGNLPPHNSLWWQVPHFLKCRYGLPLKKKQKTIDSASVEFVANPTASYQKVPCSFPCLPIYNFPHFFTCNEMIDNEISYVCLQLFLNPGALA